MRAASSMSRGVEFGKQWEGQTVDGRFPLQRYLGGSASTAVFQTQHRGSNAAIKLLHTNSRQRETQLAEWRKAAELSHPNLVRIFEGGRCWLAGDELIFIVTECAEENLSEVLPRRSLSVTETEEWVRPALDLLRFLHQRGFVHSRLRPSNVMSVSEQLKFSSDRIRPAGKVEPLPESTVYDAPEARGGTLSTAGDVWSLGVTIAEALTQKLPTKANDVLSADLPQPFADIVQHCLRQNPAQRWTPKEVGTRLQGLTVPPLPGVPEETLERSRKSGHGVRAAVTVLLIVVLALLYGWVRRASPPRPPLRTQSASDPEASRPPEPADRPPVPASTAPSSPGAALKRVPPNPSPSALRTIHGTIKVQVKVNVDPSGKVSGAKIITAGPSKYFARLSMDAARQWKFKPPVSHGQSLASQWTLLFEFTHGGAQAILQGTR
jgi:TonB family protein